jgi:gamma-glutamyltranspeptidase
MVHVETPLKPEELQTNNLDSKVWSAQSLFFGGINAVAKTGNKLEAAADNRRIGFTKYI